MHPSKLLFLVGLPRSGTKLLRGLLNNHPSVFIPEFETEFFFYWKNRWQKYGDLSVPANFEAFSVSCDEIPYFMYLAEHNQRIDWRAWQQACTDFSPEGVFVGLLKHQSVAKGRVEILGDKSPSYVSRVADLQACFPEAVFIHIVRDVRDYCLSINAAWGKNMYRAAWRWGVAVENLMCGAAIDRRRVVTVAYESLILSPDIVMRRLCETLGVAYTATLVNLDKSTENLGSATGMAGIKQDNLNKFEGNLDPAVIERIESLSFNAMHAAGYPVIYAKRQTALGVFEEKWLKIKDGLNLVKSEAADRGLLGALRYTYRYHMTTSNYN